MKLLCKALDTQGGLDPSYQCDNSRSLPLVFEGDVPENAACFALVLRTLEEHPLYHWVLYNIPTHVIGLPEGAPPAAVFGGGMIHGLNDWEQLGYKAPCPQEDRKQTYECILYTLSSKTDHFPPGISGERLLYMIQKDILSTSKCLFKV